MRSSSQIVAFCWQSSSLTGAQRRFLALASYLNERGLPTIILLETKDKISLQELTGRDIPYLVGFEWPLCVRLLGRGRDRLPKLWKMLGLRFLFYRYSKRYLAKLGSKLNIGLWHVSMSSHFAHAVSRPAVFEVTSPDWADRLISRPDTVPKNLLLNAVSRSVHQRLLDAGDDRRVYCAPEMFPNVDPTAYTAPDMSIKEKIIVFAHRLIPRKNAVLFARVVNRFIDAFPDWRVVIRGEGPDEQKIRVILDTHVKAGRAEVGYITDLSQELRRSRIFVSIIEQDNYPSQSVLEAMVHGNALLLSDRGHTREKFYDENGIITEITEHKLYSSLSILASRLVLLDEMGMNSFKLAVRRFSRQKYLEYLKRLYREAGFIADN